MDGRWVWYGGRLSVDFVNTLRYRFEGGRELLKDPADLAAWLAAAGLCPAGVPVAPADLVRARELREAIDGGIRAAIERRPLPARLLRVLNDHLERAPAGVRLVQGVDGLRREDVDPAADVDALLCRVAVDAADLLGTDARGTVRICPGDGCSGRFVDRSPGRRRRWCSMAGCGNRAKVAHHRQGK